MNELKIFNNAEFGCLHTITVDNEPWFVGKEVAETLGYSNPRDALSRHVDEEDKNTVVLHDGTSGNPNKTIINESGLYSLILSSKLPNAKKFKRWVTSEVLPSIRKTGSYQMPQDYPAALRALAEAEEKRLALATENERQKQTIADMEPIKQYVDTILESTSTMTTSQIAADYDMSARRLNRILFDEGIQRNVNGQWILYKKHMGNGYTKSKTFSFTHSDGREDVKMQTQWTQKGRLMIHEALTRRGILAVMDRDKVS